MASTILYVGKSLVLGIGLSALAALDFAQDDLTLARTLIVVALVLTVVQFILSMATRHTVLRVIPCLHVQCGLTSLRVLGGLIKILLTVALSVSYLMIIQKTGALQVIGAAAINGQLEVSHVLDMIVLFRAFARAFHDPLGASIESLALLYYDSALYLCIFAFLLHRARVLLSQAIYMLVSVVTAMKNKKQRFANQGICFAL